MEKLVKPVSGYFALVLAIICLVGAIYCLANFEGTVMWMLITAIVWGMDLVAQSGLKLIYSFFA